MIFLGTRLIADSRELVIRSLAGCLKKLFYGREELGPSRSLSKSRWSSGAGHDVMLVRKPHCMLNYSLVDV